MKGTVKWFDYKKGYGIIIGEDNVEYFVHYSQIAGEGFKSLHRDDKVTFTATTNGKGPMAADVNRA